MTIKKTWPVDRDAAVECYYNFLLALGYSPDAHPEMNAEASGKNTAERAVDAYIEFFSKEQEHFQFTTFSWGDKHVDEIVAVTHVEFTSMCAHHFLPYVGVCHIGYIPHSTVCGLSKIIRIVDHYAHRPSIQEDLTNKIATFLMEQLKPKGCGVIIEATHSCMSIRGVCRPRHVTVTSDMRGFFKAEETKNEFLQLIEGARSRVR